MAYKRRNMFNENKKQETTEIVLGQTQLLSTLTESKDPLQRPTPEESEYFYEDYVEYEENTTLPYNLTKLVAISTTASPPTSIPPATAATPSTIPPAVLSHFIPGDTPTLYAGGAKPPSRPDEPKEQQKPQGPTFTFFGMPLHTINLGGFWGSGRDGEGRSRFPGAKGRVQQIPGHPNVEKGFLPIVPGGASGGFKPVFSPFDNRTSGQFSKPIKLNYTIWDLPSQPEGGFPQATVSKVDPEEEEAERVSRLTAEGFNSTKGRPPKVDIETTSDDAPFHGLNGIEAAYETTTVPVTTPEILTRPPITFLPTVTFRVSKGEPTTEPYGPEFPTTIRERTARPSQQSRAPFNPGHRAGGPSSLSGFLAPGGQLPVYKPAGRPTITKVTVSPLGAGPSPVAEEIHQQGPRQPKSPPSHHYPDVNTPRHQTKSSLNTTIAWYYKNYNSSNLEPFVGGRSGTVAFRNSSPSPLPSRPFLAIAVTLIARLLNCG